MLLATAMTLLATLLAQSYGGGSGGSGSSRGGSGRSYGISYGPGFWAIAALVLVTVLVVAMWLIRRYRSRRSTAAGHDQMGRTA